jgi:hypothetical protein
VAKLRWKRSDEGYTGTHCLRFEIVPVYMGTTRAQAYELYEYVGSSRKRHDMHDTQTLAKAEAQRIEDSRGNG